MRCFCCGTEDKDLQEEPTEFYEEKGMSFYSVTESFYGRRSRIPSKVDLVTHPSEEWWSDARLDAPHVAEDLGDDAMILSKTIKLKVINGCEKTSDELSYFDAKQMSPANRYLVLQLLLGPKIVVSIAEVSDKNIFDDTFRNNDNTHLMDRLKLIVNPANVSIPWAVNGPKNSASIRDFFGNQNCSVKLKYSAKYICHAVITIDVYSKFMIRSFLPKLAFQPGRICDFILVDYQERLIHTGFRLVSTQTLLGLLKDSKHLKNS